MAVKSSSAPLEPPSGDESIVDRPALLEKARTFLSSPDVRYENEAAKRRFLEEKGLTGEEIDALIRDLPRQPPPIPPRTYPLPPPSNVPGLLAGLFKAFTWIAGASGVLILGYYRFLLPRLNQSLAARHQLKLHQYQLLGSLRRAIEELKETQTLAFESLYRYEDLPADIKSLADLPVSLVGKPTHHLGIVVRCAFLGDVTPKLTLEDLYQRLLTKFPGLKTANGSEYKHSILRELSCSDSFEKSTKGDVEYWSLRQDSDSSSHLMPSRHASCTQSLKLLRDAVSRGRRSPNSYQHTFKSLTDLTAYLSRETFAKYGTSAGFRYGLQGTQPLSPAEEDVRREIRALKGLVLNRRTFAPSSSRPIPTPINPATAVAS